FVPMGSLGTAAGLVLGLRLAGLRTRVGGGVTSYRWYATAKRGTKLARRTLGVMRRTDYDLPDIEIEAEDLDVVDSALGEGYAAFTEASIGLAKQFGELEGVVFDGTYSAKTLAGAMAYVRDRGVQRSVHLLWHTYQRIGDSG